MQRISPLATRSNHDNIVGIDRELIRTKISDAKANLRLREIHCFHADNEDTLHRMLNAIEPGSYVRPHRHHSPPKPESVVVVSGCLALIAFQDDGTPIWQDSLLLSQDGNVIGADIRAGVWHTLVSMESGTVMFEVKPGPYSSLSDKDFASWAPDYNSERAQEYLDFLEKQIQQRLV